jgi:hypothetical protein
MRTIIFLLLSAGVLPAQSFTFGVRGGVRLTTDLDNYDAASESKRYVVGPMATVGLPLGFRFELDALYRRVADRNVAGSVLFYSNQRDSGNSWEFPMIVRHGVGHGFYAGVGYAPRTINGTSHADVAVLVPVQLFHRDQPGEWTVTHGVIGAAGFERRAGPVRIAPEVRYTFWTSPALNLNGSQGYFVQSSQHQVDFLLGIHFGGGK